MNPPLAEWQSFYVIVGSSGAALIGIQFVVMTFIANMRERPTADSLSAFETPTSTRCCRAASTPPSQ